MIQNITKKQIIYLILIASCTALAAAWIAEYIFGLLPCSLCFYQRYLYITAIVIISIHLFLLGSRMANVFLLLIALSLMAVSVVAGYQFAVENHWVELPNVCKSAPPAASLEELKAQVMNTPPIPCDEVQFSLFGLSMAAYNALLSFGLGMLAIIGIFINDNKKKKFSRR